MIVSVAGGGKSPSGSRRRGRDNAAVLGDPVDDAVGAVPGAVTASERPGQRLADLVRIDRERGIAELRHGGNGFWQPAARRTSMDRHRTSVLPHGGVRRECRSARRPVRGGDSLRCARRSVWRGGAVPCPCSGADGDRAAQHPAPRLQTISYWYGDACRVKSSAYVPLRASSSECVPDSTTDPSRNT